MKRTKHNLSSYKLFTCKMAELVPANLVEVLPGDSFRQTSSFLIRLSPQMFPVMHPVTVRVHHWYVPSRLVWSGFQDFITGGPDGLGGAAGAYPTIASGSGFTAGSLADYFSIPPGVANLVVGAMPFRCYNAIFNRFYRDQDLVSTVTQDSTVVQKIAWEKDYFGTARPWAQKGPAVTLPLGTLAPVKTQLTELVTGSQAAAKFRLATTGAFPGASNLVGVDTAGVMATSGTAMTAQTGIYPTNMFADLANASASTVNDFRMAMALQRYQEARARYGSEYVDYLRYLGIKPSDARLQRPEYLGGGKQTIAFSEVLQTGTNFDANSGVGTLRGHGIAAVRTRGYTRFFEEHGYVLTLFSVRPKAIYGNSLNRLWSRRTKEDYFQKELEQVGQMPVFRREVYAQADNAGTGGDTVFGWQDRYDDYRYVPSTIAGDFRTTLNFAHMARIFGSPPALNSAFVTCDPTERIFADQVNDQLWIMASNSIVARRPVGPGGHSSVL